MSLETRYRAGGTVTCPQQLEPVKPAIDIGLQWKIHHAHHLAVFEGSRALKVATITFVVL